jgi:hypothetical protein
MTTKKQKSIRDYRGRFKKKRFASPSEAREIFDRMYARGEAEREAHLRKPEGEAERQEFNRRMRERLKKNPRKNPVGKFYICGHGKGRTWYYRHSTGSLTDNKASATAYRSRPLAERVARSIVRKLPASIASITVKS